MCYSFGCGCMWWEPMKYDGHRILSNGGDEQCMGVHLQPSHLLIRHCQAYTCRIGCSNSSDVSSTNHPILFSLTLLVDQHITVCISWGTISRGSLDWRTVSLTQCKQLYVEVVPPSSCTAGYMPWYLMWK